VEQSGDIGVIAEKDEQSMGAIWLRLFNKERKGYGDDETPEIGIGKALLRELETEAKNYGYQKICLSVDPRNPACRLYEQFGYIHVGWYNTYWIMEKD